MTSTKWNSNLEELLELCSNTALKSPALILMNVAVIDYTPTGERQTLNRYVVGNTKTIKFIFGLNSLAATPNENQFVVAWQQVERNEEPSEAIND